MTDPSAGRRKLLMKLCRELVQAERDAELHPAREARRLGAIPPADAFRAIAVHAHTVRPRLESIVRAQGMHGRALARGVASFFSGSRHLFFDRLIRTERSYRMTLLGLRHGVELVTLVYKIATRERIIELTTWCELYLIERVPLLERAVDALAWFASEPGFALRLGAGAPFPSTLIERLTP